ncbi:DUF3817 domain-containing protein [Fulvivirga lutimaris]|uniref:DUF3817 domain-containing protein n=1 Tax=Fulvivirga lutimaris TaxID=1819566 RepID=UPI0012BCFCC6|nr:DUF3817 domain-containing protein [Fulvivirga lutimaris]MTI38482.1 DUF3817 domain-containing protein [Fulvivirga lutimaris]
MSILHRRFKLLAHAEGISFLLILFITMPIKYGLEIGMPNKIVGMLHGILFIAFIIGTVFMKYKFEWKASKTVWALLSSIIPFGTFIFVKKYYSISSTQN